jgi:hypothetical protein
MVALCVCRLRPAWAGRVGRLVTSDHLQRRAGPAPTRARPPTRRTNAAAGTRRHRWTPPPSASNCRRAQGEGATGAELVAIEGLSVTQWNVLYPGAVERRPRGARGHGPDGGTQAIAALDGHLNVRRLGWTAWQAEQCEDAAAGSTGQRTASVPATSRTSGVGKRAPQRLKPLRRVTRASKMRS